MAPPEASLRFPATASPIAHAFALSERPVYVQSVTATPQQLRGNREMGIYIYVANNG